MSPESKIVAGILDENYWITLAPDYCLRPEILPKSFKYAIIFDRFFSCRITLVQLYIFDCVKWAPESKYV